MTRFMEGWLLYYTTIGFSLRDLELDRVLVLLRLLVLLLLRLDRLLRASLFSSCIRSYSPFLERERLLLLGLVPSIALLSIRFFLSFLASAIRRLMSLHMKKMRTTEIRTVRARTAFFNFSALAVFVAFAAFLFLWEPSSSAW